MKITYFLASASFLALADAFAAALAARSMTFLPLYQPHEAHMAWLLFTAPQLAHFPRRAADKA